MNETHRPSKTQALLFFFLMLLLAGGVFVWHFYINRGTATFSGPTPFTIEMGTRSMTCTQAPCVMKLPPAAYEAKFTKQGYFDRVQRVRVSFLRTINVVVPFTFQPTFKQVSGVTLPLRPIENAPLRPPYLQPDKEWTSGALAALVKSAKRTVVSPTQDKTLLIEVGKALYIYKDNKALQTTIPATGIATWVGKKIAYVTTTGTIQTVMTADGNGKNISSIVRFERPLKNLQLFGDLKGQYVLIQEDDAGAKTFYLVDTYKKTRRRLEVSPTATFARWTEEKMIFEEPTSTSAMLVNLVDPETLVQNKIDAVNGSVIVEKLPSLFYVMTYKQLDLDKPSFGISIEEALKTAGEVGNAAMQSEVSSKKIFLSEYDVANNSYRTLLEIPTEDGERVSNLTGSETDPTLLYFEKGGRVWEIKVGE